MKVNYENSYKEFTKKKMKTLGQENGRGCVEQKSPCRVCRRSLHPAIRMNTVDFLYRVNGLTLWLLAALQKLGNIPGVGHGERRETGVAVRDGEPNATNDQHLSATAGT